VTRPFLRLAASTLTAGYLEDWRWNATLPGAPHGAAASPILSFIYLHKLDDSRSRAEGHESFVTFSR
jgi:hypothetical protein